MSSLLHAHSPFRIFAFSALSSLAILIGVIWGVGWEALGITLVLTVIEVTFSFENAIVNAKVLANVSKFWQNIFLSVGIIVAIFGMRILFPIIIVSITADLSWGQVWDLALRHPEEYAHYLEAAHPTIAAFGGAFLLMLALHFFFQDEHKVLWLERIETHMQKIKHWSGPLLVSVAVILVLAALPANTHAGQTLVAGLLGAATYLFIQLLVKWLERFKPGAGANVGKQVGLAAFMTIIYLEILDASFSFDGVIGAFAITSDVILIAAGLGIGALWVRSLTVFMVRRGTLKNFVYLEHGAHYAVLMLAFILLASVFMDIAEFVPGLIGISIIIASILASLQERHRKRDAYRPRSHF